MKPILVSDNPGRNSCVRGRRATGSYLADTVIGCISVPVADAQGGKFEDMKRFLLIVLTTLMLGVVTGCQPPSQSGGSAPYPPAVADRVALVISNERYEEFSPLPGAAQDADLVADALRKQGFSLIGDGPLVDLSWAEMVQHMRVFEARMESNGVAIFYYSGHAIQINGDNFLVPVDAGEWRADTVDTELVRLAGSFRPPAGNEPRIKLVILDRTLPGPLVGSPTAVLSAELAAERLDPNEIHIFATAPNSRIAQAEALLSGDVSDGGAGDAPSILSQAFADALRTTYAHVLQVAYQIGVMVADHTGDHQHPYVRFGEAIPVAGPLVGTDGATSLISRIDEAERDVLSPRELEHAGFRSSISQLIGTDTRSIRAVSDTVATLTVLELEQTFPLARSGRVVLVDEDQSFARIEAWRRVLEESRASMLGDWQKAAVLSVASSTSSNELHLAGIDEMLSEGEFEGLPDAIESLGAGGNAAAPNSIIGLQRRRLIERALFELRERGTGAGSLIGLFPGTTGIDETVSGARLSALLNRARSAVADCSPTPLNAHQMEALTSFAISIGVPAFSTSSVCRHLGDGNLLAVAREVAHSSFEFDEGALRHSPTLMRRRAYETALFLAVTEGRARDRLHEVRLARVLEAQGIVVAEDATVADLEAISRPTLLTLEAETNAVAEAFTRQDSLRSAAYFIRMFEGLRTRAYQDEVGIWTVGYGTTGDWVGPDTRLSPQQAMQFLLDYIENDASYLRDRVEMETLSAHQEAALLSLSYNIGRGGIGGSSVLRSLNTGDISGAADHFLDWNKVTVEDELVVSPGLDRRRHAERILFLVEAEPSFAESIIVAHLPLLLRQEVVGENLAVVGYGETGAPDALPRRLNEEQARERLRARLGELRAAVSNELARDVTPAQLEALTLLAYVIGWDRFERWPALHYINEGNTQAALAALGYWENTGTGPGGRAIEHYAEIRGYAAALFVLGFRS